LLAATATFEADAILGTLVNTGTTNIDAGVTISTTTMADGGGTWNVEVDTTTSFGFLDVTGGDVDLLTSSLAITVLSGAIADGDELLIADGTATANGGAGIAVTDLVVTDNSFIWSFELADGAQAEVLVGDGSPTDDEVYLLVTEANSISSTATTSGNANAGNVLQSLVAAGDTQIDLIILEMNSASTSAELNEVLEAVQPTVDGGAIIGSLAMSAQSFGITADRMAMLRTDAGMTGMATGNASEGLRMWGQVFGQSADQDDRDGIDGYDADTFGFAVGLDTENIGNDTVVGLAFSYADTDVSSDNANTTDTDVESYQISLYADHDLDNRTYVSGMIGWVFGNNDTTRHNVGGVAGLTARGDFDSDQFAARVELGRDYSGGDNLTLTPSVMVNYAHYDADGYTETGAGGANLTVSPDDMDMFEIGVGVDASWMYQNADGSYTAPTLRVGYRHDVADDDVGATSRFAAGGATFKSQGIDPADGTFNLGAGINYFSTDNWQLTANYDFEIKADYDSHAGFLRAAYKF